MLTERFRENWKLACSICEPSARHIQIRVLQEAQPVGELVEFEEQDIELLFAPFLLLFLSFFFQSHRVLLQLLGEWMKLVCCQ